MNKISDQEIFKILQQDWNYLHNQYNSQRLLGIFVIGNANYGFAETLQDIQTQALYLPTFEDLCINIKAITIKLNYNDRQIIVRDARIIKQVCYQSNKEAEALITPYYIINPLYENVYNKYLRDNCRQIMYRNEEAKLYNMARLGMKAAAEHNAFKVLFLEHIISCYSQKLSLEACLKPSSLLLQQQLWKAKSHNLEINFQNYLNFFSAIQDQYAAYSIEQPTQIHQALIEILRIAIMDENETFNFLKSITDSEREALKAIYARIGTEGTISISNMITETGISRPIYASLLQKMKGIAEVQNRGVKGTYLKIKNAELLGL